MVVRVATILSAIVISIMLATAYTPEQFKDGSGMTVPGVLLVGLLVFINIFFSDGM